ncbi:hypothetical protein Sjap_017262 [Stephania japonica]|uniref:Uncharacterized protein n=1 Tax=Stephania japonica TaxID=461633 RepID=A0AAP0I5U3_9MAGN
MEGDLRRRNSSAEEETAAANSLQEIVATAGLPVAKPHPMEWTDEKHNLYLNYMETSFVRKLYNHEYCSAGSHSWKPKRKNMQDPNSWQKLNANNVDSDHFDMLQSGCWRKHNFEKAQPKACIAEESSASANLWVERFKVGKQSKHRAISSDLQVDGSAYYKAANIGFQSTSSRNFSACSTSSIQEVSDQNFVNEENGGWQSSSVGRSKKAKTVGSDVSENDQVVPVSKSPDKLSTCSVPQSINIGDIAYQESEHSISLDGGKRTRLMDNS